MSELKARIQEWCYNHPNPYTRDSYEDVYWTMQDLISILEDKNCTVQQAQQCEKILILILTDYALGPNFKDLNQQVKGELVFSKIFLYVLTSQG